MVQSLPPDQAHPPQTVTLIPWPRLIPPQPPAPLTQLVGREPELAAGLDLLVRREVRLVTLTGPGGVGKTRLAEAIAARARADFQDGVAWIGLAAVAESALVLPTLVRSFGIGEASGRRPLDLIATALRDQRLLLVLDNLEHLVDAAPELAACLVACPSISILTTSRTRLRVRGEHVIPVPPLSLPAAGAADPADGPGSEAVRLFWERASAAVPDLRMTPEAIEAAAEICRRVDGLPLGIELA